jgi:hypothetical protein
MSYRPITDMWFLARAKLKGGKKYYGAYLGGFPERARALLGCRISEPVLHVCGGCAKDYPYKRAFGPLDKTLDLDPACNPDFLQDAREPFPLCNYFPTSNNVNTYAAQVPWAGILMDPPYTEEDAKHYVPGAEKYPSPNLLMKNALAVLPSGGRVGLIHYILPSPKDAIFVAAVGVLCGFNNRIRVYSVFEKM